MQQLNKIYLVKNLSPWIIDEINAMAEVTSFSLILLRKQPRRYYNELNKLENKISIYIKPWINKISYKRFLFSISLLFSYITHFYGLKNFVFGIKALYWFNRLDLRLFPEPTSIHAQFATQASIISLLLKKYLKKGLSYSFTFHAHDIYYYNQWFKVLVKEAIIVFSISEYNIEYVHKKYPIQRFKDKIKLSYLGVHVPETSVIKTPHSRILNIGFLSWFVPKKGLFYLLEAIYNLKRKNIPFLLHLGGDGPLFAKAKQYIETHELSSQVIFYGKLDQKGKETFFKQLDMFVMPSIRIRNDMDGIPVVLMEAASYGLPVIASDISGLSEICIHNKNGLLFAERNVKELTLAIKKINMRNQLDGFSKSSYQIAKEKFNLRNNSRKKAEILNWL